MSYTRTTVSLSPEILEVAAKVMKERKFARFSPFIAQLIRDDWDRVKASGIPTDAAKPAKRKRHGRARWPTEPQ